MSSSPLHRPSLAVRLVSFALALASFLWSASASAQVILASRGGHPPVLESALSRPHTVSPVSGPPGTQVTVRMGGLPAMTPLWLGIGAMRSGFEALTMVYTDMSGEFSQLVEIPDWTERDKAYEFIVFDAYFLRLALTGPFDVTGRDDGTVQRRGQIGEHNGHCPTLVAEDGVTYALAGELPPMARAEAVLVEGLPIARSEECQTARAILVTRLYGLRQP